MTEPAPRAEWLRPVSERYLGDPTGPAPWTVWGASLLCALDALVAAGMVATWGPATLELLGGSTDNLASSLVTVLLAASGTGLVAVFAPGVVLLGRRGWCRLPTLAGIVLAGLTGLGFCIGAESGTPGGEAAAWYVLPELTTAALGSVGLVLLLRSRSASGWLAQRRYQVRQQAARARSEGGWRAGEQGWGG
jgi:hypothetical protein